ncbi:hypothetical protein AMATHDRAFT_50580 [Amanita thiersii Skay4041]|uniref:Mid2 domain-containing protein n=1 Tax=Amanita thiersii Skay4041 TaxID=703135 RepID=A0A2A9N8I6_9AGAR|nr:hypothetical protein AMATHDRAFT_50580 [Amanita thiersii Skay4041]
MLLHVGLSLFALALHAEAQYTTATCYPKYQWMFNHLGQSPCRIAEFMSYPCDAHVHSARERRNKSEDTFSPSHFVSPYWYGVNLRSGILFLYSWRTYGQNCSAVQIGMYPEDILSNTAIPHWAYQDVVASNKFDINVAQQEAQEGPDTTAGAAATTVTASATVVVTAGGSKGSKSNVGPIVGGVIGGVGALALIAGVFVLWFFRRKQVQNQRASEPQLLGSTSSPNMTAHTPSLVGTPPAGGMTQAGTGPALRLYDPYDPQTFPQPDRSSLYSGNMSSGTGGTPDQPYMQNVPQSMTTTTAYTSTNGGRLPNLPEV